MISLNFWSEFFSSFTEMAPWSFQLVRCNLFWPHSLERTTATESVVSNKNCIERRCKGVTEGIIWCSPSLRRHEQHTGPGRSSCYKWHGPLRTELQLATQTIPKGGTSSRLSCHSHGYTLERPNRPSSGYADSDRQLSRDGFGKYTTWVEMSSPVVSCPVTAKLKPEEPRVAKR